MRSAHALTTWTCADCSSTAWLNALAIFTAVCTASLCASLSAPAPPAPTSPGLEPPTAPPKFGPPLKPESLSPCPNPPPKFPPPRTPPRDANTRRDSAASFAPSVSRCTIASPRDVTVSTPPLSIGRRSDRSSLTRMSRCNRRDSADCVAAASVAAASGGVGGGGSVARSSSAAIRGRSIVVASPSSPFIRLAPPEPSSAPSRYSAFAAIAPASGGRSAIAAAGNDPFGGDVASSTAAEIRAIHARWCAVAARRSLDFGGDARSASASNSGSRCWSRGAPGGQFVSNATAASRVLAFATSSYTSRAAASAASATFLAPASCSASASPTSLAA
uniref:Uncharacterized protein n=1 Tax=Micromonas pusilla TaxID=38833 RepID=A0A7R9TR89_MICPS